MDTIMFLLSIALAALFVAWMALSAWVASGYMVSWFERRR